MNRLLITGANGFVGSSLAPELAARGWRLRAATRGKRAGTTPADDSVEHVRAESLGPATDWSAALEGVDAVVHLAGWAGGGKRELTARGLDGVNVGGAGRLAAQCVAMGVKRFVFLSTAKVYGESSGIHPLSLSDPTRPETAYARSKLRAEKNLLRLAARSSLELVIIRAPLIYGPNVSGNFLNLLRLCHSSIPLPLAGVDNRRSLLFVGNLCDLVDRCLTSERAAGRIVLASDDQDLSTPALIGALRKSFDLPPRLLPCPVVLLRALAGLAGRRALLDRLVDSFQVDLSATRELLDWRPPFRVEHALEETAASYTERLCRETGAYQQAFDRTMS